jgi:hypothetical protein
MDANPINRMILTIVENLVYDWKAIKVLDYENCSTSFG